MDAKNSNVLYLVCTVLIALIYLSFLCLFEIPCQLLSSFKACQSFLLHLYFALPQFLYIFSILLLFSLSSVLLTLSAPQDVTNVIKTRSRLRVWVGRVHKCSSVGMSIE